MDLLLHGANIDDSIATSAMVVATQPKRHACKIAHSPRKELITCDFCNIDNLLRLRGLCPKEREKLAEHNEPYSHDHLLIFSGFFIFREENTRFDRAVILGSLSSMLACLRADNYVYGAHWGA